jgi:hypothetical protein
MRYMGVRAVLDDNGKWPEFSEIVIYGSRNSDDSLSNVNNIRGQIYTGTLPSRKNARFTFGRVNGTNLLNGVRTQHLVNNGPVRVFTGKDYFDTARAVKNATVYIPWESPDVNYSFLDSLKAMGKIVFYTNQGARSYMSNNFGNTGWNIDSIGMEPEVMSSYTNEAKFQKNFAALYGSVNVSTSQTQWAGNPTNGRGLVKIMQIGNEVYAHGGSDIATFMMMSEAYDKIKSMDPNMIVVTPGTESHDTARTMTFSWLAYTVRADHKYPADIDDYHKYPNVVDTMRIGQTFDFGIQHLMHSEFPERWMKIGILAMTERINRRALVFMGNYNGDTTKQVATTEDGQDNWGSSTTFGSNIYSPEWTVYSTHGFAGFDSLQAKALMRSYYEFMVPFIPGEAFHCDYAMMNNFGDSVIHRQQFSSSGMASNYSGGPLFVLRDLYPWYQYRQCIYRLMQNYYADSVIAFNPLGKIHFRYRNINHPDSVINVIWYAKHDGTSLTGQTVDVGGTMFGNLVTEITPSFTNGTGTSVGRAVVGSSLTGVTFGDVPKIYVGLAIGGPVITNPQRGVPKKAFGRHVPKKV